MDATQVAALKRRAVWLVRIMVVLLALEFVLAVPGVTDRRQVLIVEGTVCATLLGLTMAFAAFVFRVHVEALDSGWGKTSGITNGMRSFWRTTLSVASALAASVLASVFGLLDSASTFSLYLTAVAGIGLIYAVLFVPLLIGDMWGVLVIRQSA